MNNDEDWDPLPGMKKILCADCGYWAATPDAAATLCVDCDIMRQRALRRSSQSPFEADRNGVRVAAKRGVS